jgi:hypothetical protein
MKKIQIKCFVNTDHGVCKSWALVVRQDPCQNRDHAVPVIVVNYGETVTTTFEITG